MFGWIVIGVVLVVAVVNTHRVGIETRAIEDRMLEDGSDGKDHAHVVEFSRLAFKEGLPWTILVVLLLLKWIL